MTTYFVRALLWMTKNGFTLMMWKLKPGRRNEDPRKRFSYDSISRSCWLFTLITRELISIVFFILNDCVNVLERNDLNFALHSRLLHNSSPSTFVLTWFGLWRYFLFIKLKLLLKERWFNTIGYMKLKSLLEIQRVPEDALRAVWD